MANPNNFIQSSDYPMEKVALIYEGTLSLTASSSNTYYTICSNPTGVRLMLDGVYSLDDWATSYPLTSADVTQYLRILTWLCSSDTIYFRGLVDVSCTMKVRLWAYLDEDDQNTSVDPTDTASDSHFIIQNNNYLKVAMTGHTTTSNQTITHNLGYIPLIKHWRYANYGIGNALVVTSTSGYEGMTVTTTTATFTNRNTYYRIYTDEA